MSDIVLSESIYIKRSRSEFGGGLTSRECILETLWFPCGVENGYVQLYPVMDDLKRVLMIKESVPIEVFQKEYSVKEDSRELYLTLKGSVRKGCSLK